MSKIRIGAVSYLNTKPFLYGIQQLALEGQIELVEDYPSRIAKMLLDDEIDMGLVPVAIIPEIEKPQIITDYCIGADGEVASVALFSETPVEQVKRVLLDYQSKTSVALVKILMKRHWKQEVVFEDGGINFHTAIGGDTAAVIIGDRALEQRRISTYIYDLAEEWKKFTGLPFVFAAWIANKPLPEDFILAFNIANKYGIDNMDKVINSANGNIMGYDMDTYYTKNISYAFTDDKREGMKLFLQYLSALEKD